VFEVRHGRIVLWRDYFDWFNATAGFLRGLVGAVIPAAKPRFSQRS
jgi:limonene-1,2-epoxide hydrolase